MALLPCKENEKYLKSCGFPKVTVNLMHIAYGTLHTEHRWLRLQHIDLFAAISYDEVENPNRKSSSAMQMCFMENKDVSLSVCVSVYVNVARSRSLCKTKPRHTTINKWIQFNYMTRGAAAWSTEHTNDSKLLLPFFYRFHTNSLAISVCPGVPYF